MFIFFIYLYFVFFDFIVVECLYTFQLFIFLNNNVFDGIDYMAKFIAKNFSLSFGI